MFLRFISLSLNTRKKLLFIKALKYDHKIKVNMQFRMQVLLSSLQNTTLVLLFSFSRATKLLNLLHLTQRFGVSRVTYPHSSMALRYGGHYTFHLNLPLFSCENMALKQNETRYSTRPAPRYATITDKKFGS
jgi:hypothetical protein